LTVQVLKTDAHTWTSGELMDITCQLPWNHSVTCYPTQVNASLLTPAIKAGTRLTYPSGMEGRVDLWGWDGLPRWFTHS